MILLAQYYSTMDTLSDDMCEYYIWYYFKIMQYIKNSLALQQYTGIDFSAFNQSNF